ncbi:MAG: SusD/RagB family nutrient-binding outer membrane lipoprotein [Candidatus Pseudobacter hemicellulosilyticus]|uniref:SusD/RagB family nutrient-binding outer membrane lipoprotein n=1 Tax=Candidatus Pseudobacter hemicellulosilyticus TaxID=3121375 RepID=A0AAJ5WN86_9BACT|nr:MAG: SusD/RagB family nutrient-binding outer membrane lipoprotein [Pseudobacter sp.]
MKHYHKIAKRCVPLLMGLALAVSGCTKNFESINTDPYGLDELDLKGDFAMYGGPFNQMQLGIHLFTPDWQYQLQTNLNADIFSGYFMTPNPFNANVNNSNYAMVDGWNNYIWTLAFDNVMSPAQAVIDRAKAEGLPNFEAWAIVLKVLTMHRISDVYGPVVYTNYGKINTDGSVTYDSQQEAYAAFFADLDLALEKLKPFAEDATKPKAFTAFDLVYGGDYVKWVKFINSLRLRLAVRIAKADPGKAVAEANKALTNSFGLIEEHAADFIIDSRNISNPLNVISNIWGDIRMGAPVEAFLVGYNDPRLASYFQQGTDDAAPGAFKGIRNGIDMPDKDLYSGFSRIKDLGTKMPLLTAAEVWFLKAEAKLNGWTVPGVNSVQEAYERGIEESLGQWGVGGQFEAYRNSTAKPIPYVDPHNEDNNVAAGSAYLSAVSPKWNDAGSNAEKLEQIITQKWIALFPESVEAWTEFRRTGYPKLFPVVINNSAGVIPNGQFIRRINFPLIEKETNQAGYQGAVQKLGGNDNIGTRLWWDK